MRMEPDRQKSASFCVVTLRVAAPFAIRIFPYLPSLSFDLFLPGSWRKELKGRCTECLHSVARPTSRSQLRQARRAL